MTAWLLSTLAGAWYLWVCSGDREGWVRAEARPSVREPVWYWTSCPECGAGGAFCGDSKLSIDCPGCGTHYKVPKYGKAALVRQQMQPYVVGVLFIYLVIFHIWLG